MTHTIKRREFITLIGSAAAWPLAARAQQPAVPVIGFLHDGLHSDSHQWQAAFHQGLREAGFVEGRNVAIEYRYAENEQQRLPALAAELIERRVAVIVVGPATTAGLAVKAATATIPVVFLSGADPVRIGLVARLNRPGGNLTGVTLLAADLTAKRIGLLHDLAPQAAAIAILLDTRNQTGEDFQLEEAETAGRNIGLRIIHVSAASEGDFDAAFETAVHGGAGALLVSPSTFFANHRDRLAALAAKLRLPVVYHRREFAAAGGLMSYGPSLPDAYRQVGVYAGRILKGEKPADLPVMLPTRFEFVLNLKTVKALGLTVPPGILAIADEVIE